MGAWGATAVVMTGWEGSAWLMIPAMVLAGMLCGGLWALIPAYLKVKLGCNEIITTLLMNYVAILWVAHSPPRWRPRRPCAAGPRRRCSRTAS